MSKELHPFLSQRQLKVGEAIKRSLIEIIRDGIHEPFLEKTSVIISEVRMTPDLKMANVYLLPMVGSALSNADFLAAINKISYKIRKLLADHVSLRYLPEIRFILDDSFDRAAKIDNLLKQ